MAVEREQRIKEDTSTAKRNLNCDVSPIFIIPVHAEISAITLILRLSPPAMLRRHATSSTSLRQSWTPI